MKKLILIIISLLLVMTFLTSCMSYLKDIIDDLTFPSLPIGEPTETESVTAAAEVKEKTRKEKDAYDKSKKLDCVSAGVLLQIPDYFSLGDNSKKTSRWYYAEKGGKTAAVNISEGDVKNYSQAEFEDDISNNKLQNAFIEGMMKSEDSSDAELINTEYMTVCGKKCCISDYKAVFNFSAKSYKLSGKLFLIYIERTNKVLFLSLGQTDNTEYTYNNDFQKIINSIRLLSEEEEKKSHTHAYKSSVTKEPTCVDAGEKTLTCSICFETKTETIPPTIQHKFTSSVIKEATCKDTGERKYTCSVCGYEYVDTIPKSTVHSYSEWEETKAATTSSNGVRERTCKICGEKQTESIPKLYPVTLPKSTRADNAVQIKKQQTLTIDDYCEFTIESINITKDVVPPRKGVVWSHYQAYDDKIYVDVCIKYKNLKTKKISADDVFDSYLIFSNIYEYRGSIIVEEDDRSDFTYASITDIAPLSSIYLHALFDASDLIKTSNGSLTAVFQMNGKSYRVNIRDGESDTVNTTEGYKTKTSGSIEKGEKIAMPGKCEFYIESINVASEIRPPNATGVYFYKKADDGNKFIDICIRYKNTREKYISSSDVISAGKLIYKNKYEYTAGGFVEENGRTGFSYLNITSIDPLCYEYIHVAYEVPNEVADNSKGLSVSLTINGNKYTVTIK